MRLIAALREARFLDADRARAYARVLVVCMSLGLSVGYSRLILGPQIFPLPSIGSIRPAASDFLAFWAAGRLALNGQAAQAYQQPPMRVLENQTAYMLPGGVLPFYYPPTFLLLCLPFAALPYLLGFAAFVGSQTAALLLCLRRIAPPDWGWLPLLAFPGLLMNMATGQNGFVTASCFAAAAIFLDRRPLLAGGVLGLLAFKPHLAIAVPVALIAARRWRAVLACAVVALCLTALSWTVLGTVAWSAFLHSVPQVRPLQEEHAEVWRMLQSTFAAARILGAPLQLAYAVQAVQAAAVLAVLAWACLRRPGGAAEASLMAIAALLCSPYMLDYDLAVAGVALAWLASDATRRGWLGWERLVGGLVFLWPLAGRLLTRDYGLAAAPVLLLLLFGLLVRRVRRDASVPVGLASGAVLQTAG